MDLHMSSSRNRLSHRPCINVSGQTSIWDSALTWLKYQESLRKIYATNSMYKKAIQIWFIKKLILWQYISSCLSSVSHLFQYLTANFMTRKMKYHTHAFASMMTKRNKSQWFNLDKWLPSNIVNRLLWHFLTFLKHNKRSSICLKKLR